MATAEKAEKLDELAKEIRQCTKCPLCASRTLAVPGDGKPSAPVMLIGEAPGKQEDQQGQPFVGAAGHVLEHLLAGIGIDRDDLFITNIVKCRPPNNRTPRKHEIDTCTAHYLFGQIELVNPQVIVLLGSVAAKKLLDVKSVHAARGGVIEHDQRQYLVTYHPAAAFYREEVKAKIEADFALLARTIQRGSW